MTVPIYLKQKQRLSVSKYHRIHGEISSRYKLLRESVVPRFKKLHSNNRSEIDQSTIDFHSKYDFLLGEKLEQDTMDSIKDSIVFFFKSLNLTNPDWSRGRISGQVISIILKEGEIIEKVYLTPKGNIICVRKNELGLFFNFLTSV